MHVTDDVQSESDTCTLSDRFSETKSEKLSLMQSPETSSYVVADGQHYSRGDSEEFQLEDDIEDLSIPDEVFRTNDEYRHADFNGDSMRDLNSSFQDSMDTLDLEIEGDLTIQQTSRFRQCSPDYVPKDSGFSATSYPPAS